MPEVSPGGTLDQYAVEDVIARSGMATIFRARDLESGQPVVLKVPHLQFEADIVFHQRFQREEAIGLKLEHPGVVRVLRPKEKSRVYIAMELVEGELLRDRLRRESPLPIPLAVDVTKKLAEVLEYLHDHQILHRDLKPENIMLLADGGVKLMDFGIAVDTTLGKMTWGGLSQAMGTPDYMAPEQIKGQRGDSRTDLYSVGCILYEMLTGRVPFPSENIYAAMHTRTHSLPPSPRNLRPEISPQLDEVVMSCLEIEPAKRPESAFELREKLVHPQSVVLVDRTQVPKPSGMSRGVRLAVGIAALATLLGFFRWVAALAK